MIFLEAYLLNEAVILILMFLQACLAHYTALYNVLGKSGLSVKWNTVSHTGQFATQATGVLLEYAQ